MVSGSWHTIFLMFCASRRQFRDWRETLQSVFRFHRKTQEAFSSCRLRDRRSFLWRAIWRLILACALPRFTISEKILTCPRLQYPRWAHTDELSKKLSLVTTNGSTTENLNQSEVFSSFHRSSGRKGICGGNATESKKCDVFPLLQWAKDENLHNFFVSIRTYRLLMRFILKQHETRVTFTNNHPATAAGKETGKLSACYQMYTNSHPTWKKNGKLQGRNCIHVQNHVHQTISGWKSEYQQKKNNNDQFPPRNKLENKLYPQSNWKHDTDETVQYACKETQSAKMPPRLCSHKSSTCIYGTSESLRPDTDRCHESLLRGRGAGPSICPGRRTTHSWSRDHQRHQWQDTLPWRPQLP